MRTIHSSALLLLVALLLASCSAFDRLDSRATAVPTPTSVAAAPELPTAAPPTAAPTATVAPPTAEPTAAPTPTELEARGVFIDELQVGVLDRIPAAVQAAVRGHLSDGCTTIRGVKVEREGDTFHILLDVFRDPVALCTQALVPFEEVVKLDVDYLAAGTYQVVAGELQATFTLVADNIPPPAVDLSGASLAAASDMARPGDTVELRGSGFPAGETVELGLGMLNSEYELVDSAVASAIGTFAASLALPPDSSPGQIWVFVAAVDTATVLSGHVTIIPGSPNVTAVPPEANVNVPVNGRFTRTYIFLIALEDNGASGPPIGCGDSIIPVIAEIEPTVAPMGAAYRQLLAMKDEFFGESGLYNALYRSNLTLDGINIANRQATVRLSGELVLGGACDAPRLQAQLAETALQYTTVSSVRILVNGTPLEQLLSGQ
jgi:hypothetical protein